MATFTVIVPIHNGAEFIDGCVRSILAQSRIPEEILLVDDGSTDSTPMIINEWASKEPRIKSFILEKCGVSSARNFGAHYAKSEYLMFLDVDDRWFPSKVLEHEIHIIQHSGCNFSFSLSQTYDVKRKKLLKIDVPQTSAPNFFNVLMHEFQIQGSASSVCIRKELSESVSGFREDLSRGEDWEMWVRCAALDEPCEIGKVLVSICRRGSSVEQTRLKGIENFYSTTLHLRVWGRYLDEIKNPHFIKMAATVLVVDLWKNRYMILKEYPNYKQLLLSEGGFLLQQLGIKGKKFLITRIVQEYLRARRNDF